jgi:hypothetical protein
MQQGRLSGPGRPHDCGESLPYEIDGDPVEGADFSLAASIDLAGLDGSGRDRRFCSGDLFGKRGGHGSFPMVDVKATACAIPCGHQASILGQFPSLPSRRRHDQ